jgi:tetratricopeptide (TPR) repeat protein
MRRTPFLVLATLLAALRGNVAAQDRPAAPPPAAAPSPPPKPDTPEQAADKAIAAFQAKDQAKLEDLAAKDDPDPWLVADELCAKAAHDAAEAFAKAVPRKDVETLPGYVTGRRGKADDAAARKALIAADAALREDRAADALAASDHAAAARDTVVSLRTHFARGDALRETGRVAEAATQFRNTADAARALGWLALAAHALYASGDCAMRRSDFRGALESWQARLAVEEARGNRRGIARSLSNVGMCHASLGDIRTAMSHYERAIGALEAAGDRAGVAGVLGNLGNCHESLGDFGRALTYFERTLKVAEDIGDPEITAKTLLNMGVVHVDLGDHARALACYQRAATIAEQVGDKGCLAAAIGNLGNSYARLGDYAKSQAFYDRSLRLKETLGNRAGVAITLRNIGGNCYELGKFASALSYYERALNMAEELGQREEVAAALVALGNVHARLGDYPKALSLQKQALALADEIGARARVADALGNIGGIHFEMGNFAEALSFQERALALEEELERVPGIASTLCNIANGQRAAGRPKEALATYRRAQALMDKVDDRLFGAVTLLNIAAVESDMGENEDARSSLTRSLAVGEEMGAWEHVVSCLSGLATLEENCGRNAEAEAAARRAVQCMASVVGGLGDTQSTTARTRYLDVFEVGALASAALERAGDVCFFLESGRAGSLLEMLSTRVRLKAVAVPEALRNALDEGHGEESASRGLLAAATKRGEVAEVKQLHARLAAAQARLTETVERIQREAKAAADVTYPKADDLPVIQARLGPAEALVLYGVTNKAVVALVVTAKDARILDLGPVKDVDAACAAFAPQEEGFDPAPRVGALRGKLVEPLRLAKDTQRLLVSPDGALSYVPFALLAPEYEVVYVPSGTTYGILLEERARRGEGVLALGDPVYAAGSGLPAVASMRGRGALAPLPHTRDEVEAVGTVKLLGTGATETGLRAALAKAPRWRAVHLACHGCLDTERPQLSSLAITPEPGEDGLLTVLEVFQMKIPADLVVLSACETGRGKVVRGEGILGMTRAFMFAGAPRVLVSLWKVDDEATSALMTRFYEGFKKGVGAAKALREAQAYVAAQEKWRHPRFWAAWVLWGLPE